MTKEKHDAEKNKMHEVQKELMSDSEQCMPEETEKSLQMLRIQDNICDINEKLQNLEELCRMTKEGMQMLDCEGCGCMQIIEEEVGRIQEIAEECKIQLNRA